jgi:hypothetical protein
MQTIRQKNIDLLVNEIAGSILNGEDDLLLLHYLEHGFSGFANMSDEDLEHLVAAMNREVHA